MNLINAVLSMCAGSVVLSVFVMSFAFILASTGRRWMHIFRKVG